MKNLLGSLVHTLLHCTSLYAKSMFNMALKDGTIKVELCISRLSSRTVHFNASARCHSGRFCLILS